MVLTSEQLPGVPCILTCRHISNLQIGSVYVLLDSRILDKVTAALKNILMHSMWH